MADIDVNITLDGTFITDQDTVTPVSGDFVLISDTSDSGDLKKVDALDFLGGGTNSIEISYFNLAGGAWADGAANKFGQQTANTTGLNGFARIPLPTGTFCVC